VLFAPGPHLDALRTTACGSPQPDLPKASAAAGNCREAPPRCAGHTVRRLGGRPRPPDRRGDRRDGPPAVAAPARAGTVNEGAARIPRALAAARVRRAAGRGGEDVIPVPGQAHHRSIDRISQAGDPWFASRRSQARSATPAGRWHGLVAGLPYGVISRSPEPGWLVHTTTPRWRPG
jgi:hypothetical protein